jgi:hypothetical protein
VRIAVALALWVASAEAPAGQGRVCDAKNACPAGLECIEHVGRRATCELVCDTSAKCPPEQRCVKEGARRVCRPIYDGLE